MAMLVCFAALLFSCRPKGILHSWEMREVLVDLHKTDALLQVSGLQHGHEEAKTIYYAMVLEKHGITQSQFDSSLVWYTAHPQLFDKIYPRVLKQLETEREAFEAEYAAELNRTHDIQKGMPDSNTPSQPARPALTEEQLDSLFWVMRHGMPTRWQPYYPEH